LKRSRPSLYIKQGLSSLSWSVSGSLPNEEAVRVSRQLRQQGIAVTSAEELGLCRHLIQELRKECVKLADSPAGLQYAEDRRNDPALKKDYFFRLLGQRLIRVETADVFNKVALDPILLSIANDYLGCYAWLLRYNVWLNLPVGGEPKSSQLWHRDYGARDARENVVKMFLLLSDVTMETGAFSYIPGTQLGGWRSRLSPKVSVRQPDGSLRTTDEDMKTVISESEWITPVGGPGTIIFTDTSGFHKGGYVRTGRRLLFKALYSNWLCTMGPMVLINHLGDWDSARGRAVRWACSWS